MRYVHSVVLSCAVASLFPALASAQTRVEYNIASRLRGQLATRPPYPAGRADDVNRPGFNGRLWIGRTIIGGQTNYAVADDSQGTYGAGENDNSMAYVRIGSIVSAVSPWEVVRGSGNHSLEAGRQQWLAEQGYTGGVRTFVNEAYLERYLTTSDQVAAAPDSQAKKAVEPRATIHLPIDQPRFKSRMHVKATGAEALVTLARKNLPMQISWPQTARPAGSTLTRVITSTPAPAQETATQVAGK